jgi:RNA polymerase-associated protein
MALSQRSRTVLTLYSASDCVQCHRVRLVLAAKGVVYDLVAVNPRSPPEDLLDLNPYNSVPTLVDRDLVLYDTSVICEYLDERYPHPPLMPVDPLSRARLRLAIMRIERDWLPFIAQIQAGGRPAETARKRMREALLASIPLFKAAKFFLNPELSLADCALAPLIWRLPSLNVALPPREAHAISDYGDRIFRNPGFTRSLTPEEKALRP